MGPPWSLAAGELCCPPGFSHQPREVFRNVSQLKTASQSASMSVRLDAGGGADVSPAQPHGRSTPPSLPGAGHPPPSSFLEWWVSSWFSGCGLAAAALSGTGGTVGQAGHVGKVGPVGQGSHGAGAPPQVLPVQGLPSKPPSSRHPPHRAACSRWGFLKSSGGLTHPLHEEKLPYGGLRNAPLFCMNVLL